MAIARVAKGTANGAGSDPSLSSVALSAGSTLIVAIMWGDAGSQTLDGVTWNGNAMTLLNGSAGTSNGAIHTVWALYNVAGATANIATTVSGGPLNVWALTAIEVTGATATPLDQQNEGIGSGTAPSSGATPTTTQANELLLGFVGVEGPVSDSAGSWANSFTAGQRTGTTGQSVDVTQGDGYRIVSATGAYTASKSGMTSRDWCAFIITLKESGGGTQTLTPATVTMSGSVPGPTVAIGSVTLTPATVAMTGSIGVTSFSKGAATITPARVAMTMNVGVPSYGGIAPDGDITVLRMFLDNEV